MASKTIKVKLNAPVGGGGVQVKTICQAVPPAGKTTYTCTVNVNSKAKITPNYIVQGEDSVVKFIANDGYLITALNYMLDGTPHRTDGIPSVAEYDLTVPAADCKQALQFVVTTTPIMVPITYSDDSAIITTSKSYQWGTIPDAKFAPVSDANRIDQDLTTANIPGYSFVTPVPGYADHYVKMIWDKKQTQPIHITVAIKPK